MTGMVPIAGGTFRMGASATELSDACAKLGSRCARTTLDREQPPREVHVSPFLLDVDEATNDEFVKWLNTERQVMRDDADSHMPRFVYDEPNAVFLADTDATSEYSGLRIVDGVVQVVPGFENRPVVHITWDAARRYCAFRGKRLPTEAERDFAAGGVARRRFPWGDEEPRCGGVVYANTDCKGLPIGAQPVSVGDQDWSPEGVHGLGGNVAEWVEDAVTGAFYRDCGVCLDPVQGPDPNAVTEFRAVRGGSWASSINIVRAAGRSPWDRHQTASSIGVRCALSVAK
jgi:formylglycine-generating enzyme required for sulfatase activity